MQIDNQPGAETVPRCSEDDFVPLSSLQHYLFCPRQCYLIHREDIWGENYFTAAGSIMHRKVDSEESETIAPGFRQVRSLPLRSLRLGVSGRADLVEFDDNRHRVYPVEYKLGKPKTNDADLVQLCAQAFCLEEMLHCDIAEGAMFYGRTRRRTCVEFTASLRETCQKTAEAVHILLDGDQPPPPLENREVCKSCSLNEFCLPTLAHLISPERYLMECLKEDHA